MAPLSGLLITEPKQGKTRTDSTYEWGNNGGKVSQFDNARDTNLHKRYDSSDHEHT